MTPREQATVKKNTPDQWENAAARRIPLRPPVAIPQKGNGKLTS
jgi:hypothetical protein